VRTGSNGGGARVRGIHMSSRLKRGEDGVNTRCITLLAICLPLLLYGELISDRGEVEIVEIEQEDRIAYD
jgi:hypothetical protein